MSEPIPEQKSRTVVDGVILHLAVTAIQKFDVTEYGGCELKWWYDKVQGRKEAKRKWHETGDSVDAQIGHYLAFGVDVLGQIARPAIPFLPAPGRDLLLQWGLDDRPRPVDETGKFKNWFPPEQSLVRAAGIPLIGFTDILNGREQYLVPTDEYGEHVELRHEPGVVEVEDVKTTSSLTYAKKHEELGRNTQLLGYAKLIEAIVPSATHVRLSHNVSLTSGSPKSIKRSTLVGMSAVRDRWQRVDGVAEQMKSVAGQKNERDVEGNLAACKSYGGCPCRDFCWKYKSTNAVTRLRSKMGLLKGRQSAPNGAPQQQAVPSNGVQQQAPVPQIFQQPQFGGPQAPPQQQYAQQPQVQVQQPPPQQQQQYAPPQQQAEPQPPQGHIWAKDAVQGEPYFVNGQLTIYLSSTSGRQSFLPVVNGQAGGTPMLVDYGFPIIQAPPQTKPAQSVHRDPAAPPPPPPLAQQTHAPQPQYAPPQGLQAPSFAPGAQTAPPPPAGPPAQQGEPKKRARRTNAQIAADNAAQAAQAAQGAPAQGITLFVNAVPNGQFTDLSGYVADAAAELQEQFGAIDIRVPPSDQSPLAFSRWKGLLAQVAKQDPPPPGTYVAFTRGNELTEVVVEALAPLCAPGQLVRGV